MLILSKTFKKVPKSKFYARLVPVASNFISSYQYGSIGSYTLERNEE